MKLKLFKTVRPLLVLLALLLSVGVHAQQLSLQFKEVPLTKVLEEITASTGYKFVYSDALKAVYQNKRFSVNASGESMKSVLDKLFKGAGIAYTIEGKQIVLAPESIVTKGGEQKQETKQAKQLSGVVQDELGETLPGVTVLNKNTGKLAASSISGAYSIEAGEGDILLFSSIGMSDYTAVVGKASVLNVSMKPDAIALEDIVVTGYQTLSKERVTGSFAKVTSEKFENKRLNTLGSLIEGEIPGYSRGLIRGVTSMNGNTSPLYVVDGFPVENTRYNSYGRIEEGAPSINMEDVESITILKDAAATSIYGARAANGVIVITTKTAKSKEPQVSFSTTLSVTPYSYYTDNVADASVIVGLEKEWAATNPNMVGAGAQSYARNLLKNAVYNTLGMRSIINYHAGNISESQMNAALNEYAAGGYRYINDVTKWAKRNTFMQQYNLSVNKATEKNSVNASFSYRNNKLEDKYSKNQSFGLNITNTTHIRKWLQLDLGSYTNYGIGKAQSYDLYAPGYSYDMYDGLVNLDGSNYTSLTGSRYSSDKLNTIQKYKLYQMDITPLDEMAYNITKNNEITSRNYARITVKFVEWLKYSGAFQYEYGRYENKQFREKESFSVRNLVNMYVSSDGTFNLPYGNINSVYGNTSNSYNFRQQLDFNRAFKGDHSVVALVGFEMRHSKINYESSTRYNYDPDMLTHSQINGSAIVGKYFSGIWGGNQLSADSERELLNRYVSVYANAAYTYKSRYTATGSVRWDRSNLWSTDSKYQNKPSWSAGISWNLDKEDFMKVSWLDMLKLRASYGTGGNVSKDSAPYLTINYSPNPNVGGIQGAVQKRPNPELSWEKTSTFNIGVDFSMFNNRLSGTMEYYDKKGFDLLASTMGVPTEGFGYSTYTMNNGEMINRGVEISLNGAIVRKRDWIFNMGVLMGYNKNEVTYVNVEAPVYYLQLDYPESYPRIGNPYNAIYGYTWAGLSNKGLPQVYDSKGNVVSSQPTDLQDIQYLGTYTPVYSGAVNLNLQYKNWDLSALFLYEGGHKIRNTFVPYVQGSNYSGRINARVSERWMQPGDEYYTDVPRMLSSENKEYSSALATVYAKADLNVLNASNFRLRNLSLSYRISGRICEKICMKGIRVQGNIENLFTLAGSKEVKYLIGGYAPATYSLGLSVNF